MYAYSNSLRTGYSCMLFCHLLIFFQNQLFSKNSIRNTIRVANSLDQDQAGQNVGPDLDPNCLQKLSADNTSRQRVNGLFTQYKVIHNP